MSRSCRLFSCGWVVAAVVLGGCFDVHGPPPIDGRDRLPDASRADAGTIEPVVDAGVDAWVPYPTRDAGPLPEPRGTVLALAFDRTADTITIHELDEEGIVRSIPVPREPHPWARRDVVDLHVSRDGSWHVIETREYSSGEIEGFVQRYDPARDEWTRRELPAELRRGSLWFVLPDGAEDIFALRPDDNLRLVRWGPRGVVVESTVPLEPDVRVGAPFGGGDGFAYFRVSGGASRTFHAFDPVTLEVVRILEPEVQAVAYTAVDVDGSLVMFDSSTDRLVRWHADGTVTSGDRGDEVFITISREGRILAADLDNRSAVEYSPDLRRVRSWALPMPSASAVFRWAWADPAAR